jgi:hypothetical protein
MEKAMSLGEMMLLEQGRASCPRTPSEEYDEFVRRICYRTEELDDYRSWMAYEQRLAQNPPAGLGWGRAGLNRSADPEQELAAYAAMVEFARADLLVAVKEFWAFMEAHGERVPVENHWHQHTLQSACEEYG